ncbi:hypothetical protein O0L34_g19397 [Tuta absoluta]|nr:hypothetical protein O0L34_g19397 [Tuta absoluta]
MDERQQQRIMGWLEEEEEEILGGSEDEEQVDQIECEDQVSEHDTESEQECDKPAVAVALSGESSLEADEPMTVENEYDSEDEIALSNFVSTNFYIIKKRQRNGTYNIIYKW